MLKLCMADETAYPRRSIRSPKAAALTSGVRPADKTLGQLIEMETSEDLTKGVVGGNAIMSSLPSAPLILSLRSHQL